MNIYHLVDYFIARYVDRLRDVIDFHQTITLLVDDLTLFVGHVVVLQ